MMEKKQPKDFGPIGVIGLGNMGGAMAKNIVQAGFEVIGTDLVEAARNALVKAGGKVVDSAGEVGRLCRYIISSLPNENALQAVVPELADSCKDGNDCDGNQHLLGRGERKSAGSFKSPRRDFD